MHNKIDKLILAALDEDISYGDITTDSIVRTHVRGEAYLLCKQDGVIAGLHVFERVFSLLDDDMRFEFNFQEGDYIRNGDIIGKVEGGKRAILSGERTALNYLQRMSGIATHTRKVVKMLEGTGIKLLDTRKTTPNNRIFEKYAVKVGGGCNHRFNLFDGILIKDNHIAAAGGISEAVRMVRENAPFTHKIEVEVENIDMLKEALEAKADIIMLDNMSLRDMREAVKIVSGRALIECSGNITAENIMSFKDIGVNYISSGALTYSSSILDLSLKLRQDRSSV